MDQTKVKTTAGDFFIYLGIIIGLYVSTFSLISTLMSLINKWLPDPTALYSYDYSAESLRMSLAALIIFFPVFIYLSKLSTKAVIITPEKKDLWVRRWFFFLTLFLTGLAMAVDLVTLVYRFIGGEDLTLRFLLKVLVVFVITFAVFRFYLYELRRDVTIATPKRKYLSYFTSVIVLIVIVVGILAIGSPTTQRNIRLDEQRTNDLSNIQNAVLDYYRNNDNTLPKDLNILSQGSTYYLSSLKDPKTATDYEYRLISANKYELCATFSADSSDKIKTYPNSDLWKHGVGRTCFDRIAGELPTKI
ncbi:MAG: DUF5671 domain-containing protein [Candidatus Paceibacterota bacterium]